MTTVLLVDDQEIARAGMRTLLAQEQKIKIVGEASNGLNALKLAKKLNPQLVFMDIYMPGIDGLETTRKILLLNPYTKIIVISITKEWIYPSRFLKIGVVGYLSKESLSQEIFKAIYTVLKDKVYISPSIAQMLALQRISHGLEPVLETLSLRELQMALMICNGKKTKQIADIFYISEKTIMGYRNSLFKKLNIQNDVQLILLARKLNLLDDVKCSIVF